MQASIKSDKKRVHYITLRPTYTSRSVATFFLEREMLQAKIVQKITTHILCSVTFFLENRAFYEIMWGNVVQPDRPQMTTLRMRIACWTTEGTDTQNIFFPLAHNPHWGLYFTAL